MKYSGIGGQAVLEGVMMRNKDKYAVAVRKPNKEIEIKISDFQSISGKYSFLKMPLLRGIINFVESLFIGMKALSFSSELFEEEEEKPKKKGDKSKKEEKDSVITGLVVAFSILMAIGVFMVLPYGLSLLFQKFIESNVVLTILEGVIRFVILVTYMVGIAFLPDIKRVYMYHGAEHKAINCVEEGLPLTVENVRKMTRKHLRCGTSFIIDVIILSIILFMFIRVENLALRLIFRIVLVPVIAAFAYEFLRLAGTSNHPFVKFLSIPGLWFQGLTTKEPDNKMIEVAIASIEAVFDWRSFLEGESDEETACCQGSTGEAVDRTQKEMKKNVKSNKKGNKHKEKIRAEKEVFSQDEVKKESASSNNPDAAPVAKQPSQSEIQREKLLIDKKNTKGEGLASRQRVAMNVIEEEEDDEILSALDKFFNSHRMDDKKSSEKKK